MPSACSRPAKALQRQLAREMRARLKEDDSEVPQPDGPFAYYARFRPGGQHRIFCRKPREGGKETILLDGDARAAGKAFFQFLDARHSPDHSKVAWSADDKGSEIFTLHVRDVENGIDLDDAVGNCTGHVVWTRDSQGFLYVSLDENHRPCRVLLHRIGTPASEDIQVYRGGRSRLVHQYRRDAARRRWRSFRCTAMTPPRRMSSTSTILPRRRASSLRASRACAIM